MSYDLVVDHIVEGDKTNYAVSNLQFLTIAEQNIARTFARVSTIITV